MPRPFISIALLALNSCGSSSPQLESRILSEVPPRVVDIEGHSIDLGESLNAGRRVALVFWQTWCKSCIEEAPLLVDAARELEDSVTFVGVIPGPDDAVDLVEVRRMARELGLPYPQVRDRDLALTTRFAVDGTPTIIVLGSTGEVLYRGHRVPEAWR